MRLGLDLRLGRRSGHLGTDVEEPEITVQPEGGYVHATAPISIEVEATGATSYQWESFDGDDWNDLPGEDGPELAGITIAGVWRCRVTGPGGTVWSHAVNTGTEPDMLDGIAAGHASFSLSRRLNSEFGSAALYTQSSGAVTGLVQQSDLGVTDTLVQATSGKRPSVQTVNGRTMARFDGSNDQLVSGQTSDDYVTKPFSTWLISGVLRAVTLNNGNPNLNNFLLGDADSQYALLFRNTPGSGSRTIQFLHYDGSDDLSTLVVADGTLIDAASVIEYWHKVSAGGVKGRINGGSYSTAAASGDTNSTEYVLNVGGGDFGNTFAQYDLCELVIFWEEPTSEQLAHVTADMKAWAEGGRISSWLFEEHFSGLPGWGAAWQLTANGQEYEERVDGKSVFPQFHQAGNRLGVLFAADNPDWLTAQRFLLNATDGLTSGGRRSELSTWSLIENGDTLYCSFWFMIDGSSTFEDQWNLFGQIHADAADSSVDGTSPTLGFELLEDGRWQVLTRFSTDDPVNTEPGGQGTVQRYITSEALTLDQPHHVVYEVCFDPAGTGSVLRVWLDGVQVVNLDHGLSPGFKIGFTAADDYYWKWGIYYGGDVDDGYVEVYYSGVEWGADPGVLDRIAAPLRCPF